MEWNEKQILETLRLIEQSDYDEIKLETDNFKLHVIKSGTLPANQKSAEGSAHEEVSASPSVNPVNVSAKPVHTCGGRKGAHS